MDTGERLLDFTEQLPGKSATADKERTNRIVNSTIAYVASYTFVYVMFYVITAITAKKNLLFSKLFFFKVEFSQNYSLWTQKSVFGTFIWPPLWMLFIGIAAFALQRIYRKRPGIAKLLFLWLGIHGLNFFCTQLALMPFKNVGGSGTAYTNFLGIVADYYYWQDSYKIVCSIMATIFLIVIGAIAGKPFIQITNTTQDIHKNENRVIYLFQMVVIPYLVGSLISLIYFSDGLFIVNIATVCTLLIVIISLFINGLKNKMIMIYRFPETGEINNKALISLAAVLILMKVFLNNGIRF